MKLEPYQKAEIPGPSKAFAISNAKLLLAKIKKAKKPLMIIGHKSLELEINGKLLIDYLVEIAKKYRIPVITSTPTYLEIKRRGYETVYPMNLIEAASMVKDPSWTGFDGKGNYDLVFIAGFPYYYEWLTLSGLKHFSSIETISLDPYYQPHASWSFPTMKKEEWAKIINELLE